MDFNQVRYFLALADTLSFTRAAERCYVSQPALTQAIQRLETELDGTLIDRKGKQTELTPLGRSLRGYFEQIDRTRHLVRTTAQAVSQGEMGELNIGLMCTIGPRRLAEMLNSFQMQHPMVSLVLHDVTAPSIPQLLLSGVLDGAFCSRRRPPHPQLRYIDLFEEDLVIAFSPDHDFREMSTVPLSEIAGQRYIDRLHCEFREEILEFYSERDLKLDVVLRSQREDWIQSLVRDGVGVSCIPQYSILRPALDYRLISDPPLTRTVEFAVVERAASLPVVDSFIKHAKAHKWVEPDEP